LGGPDRKKRTGRSPPSDRKHESTSRQTHRWGSGEAEWRKEKKKKGGVALSGMGGGEKKET